MVEKILRKIASPEIKPYLYYSIANIVTILISLIFIPLITNVMPINEYGISATYFTYSSMIGIFVTLSLSISVDKMMIDGDKNPINYMYTIIIATGGLILAYEMIVLFISLFTNTIGQLSIFYYFYMGIYFLLSAVYSCAFYFYKYQNKYKIIFWCLIISAPIAQMSSLLLLLIANEKIAFLRILGYELPVSILGIWFLIKLFKGKKVKFESTYLAHAVKISSTLIPHLLAQSFLTQASILVLSSSSNSTLVGIYSFSFTVANVILTLIMKLYQAWSPWFYENFKQKNFSAIKNRQKNLVLIGSILVIIFNIFCKFVLKYIVNDTYLVAQGIIPILTWGFLWQYMYSFFYDVQYFNGQTKKITLVSFVSSIVCIILNLLLIGYFGVYGAAFANAISYLLLFVLHFVLLEKEKLTGLFNIRLTLVCMFLTFLFIFV